MDEGLKNAVREAFCNLYEAGLIVRGNYMVNWCTHDGALSDVEVEHKANKGKLYHLRYYFENSKDYIVVATTRPETYFGDTAVMVNPNDERYKDLIGKFVELPLLGRKIKIIADEHVDMSFGTGCVKVTPAHDTNDYEVGNRHNLEFITIFDEKGNLNEHCGEFKGLERLEARDEIIKKLESKGFVEKIEDYENQVGYCYRCKNVVEPYISKQWFVKSKIAKDAIERVNKGQSEFYPSHWINSFNAWMRELKDWCISRQLWWGHQIPVFYCECGHEWADRAEKPSKCPKCGGANFAQDPDVLDTWFSSGLWPISTLGWGNGAALKGSKWFDTDLKEFYPNSMLITGFDILFFWVARMMFQSSQAVGELPFKDIYLHALVKDKDGKKMSKSSGNVVDPLEKIDEFSADILRFTLTMLCVQGRDIRMSDEAMVISRNFTNKIYNASRFLLMNASSFANLEQSEIKTPLGAYLLSRFNACVTEVRKNIDEYRFNDAASAIYRFLWNEFCDWGIELSKADKSAVAELGSIFKESMKLLHPFMPFISEHLWHEMSGTSLESGAKSVMIMRYPVAGGQNESIEKLFNLVIESIVSIRRAKAVVDLGNAKIAKAFLRSNTDLSEFSHFIKLLAKCENVEFISEIKAGCVRDVSENLESFIELAGIDTAPILKRLNAQKTKLEKEVAKLGAMLSNEKFVANAPADVLATNKEALQIAASKLEKVNNEIESLENI